MKTNDVQTYEDKELGLQMCPGGTTHLKRTQKEFGMYRRWLIFLQ
jgi:hypothetical protein